MTFIDLYKNTSLIEELGKLGLEYNFPKEMIKKKGTYVEYHTFSKKPNRYDYDREILQITDNFDLIRMVYEKGKAFNHFDVVQNQKKIFEILLK